MQAVIIRTSLNLNALCMCSALTMKGYPSFNGEKLTKRAKRQVGFVLQVHPSVVLCLTVM